MTLTLEELAKIDTDFEAIQEIIANAPEYTTQTSYREECKDVEISVPSIGTSSQIGFGGSKLPGGPGGGDIGGEKPQSGG